MAKKQTATKRKTTAARKSNTRGGKKKKGGFSLARFSFILIVIVVLGYAGLAIWEGKLFPDSLENLELPTFDNKEGETTTEPQKESDEGDTVSETPTKDNALPYGIDLEGFDLYFTKAFDFAWPTYNASEAVIERPYYTLRYSEEYEQAIWVSYPLWADSLRQETFKRKDNFREDRRVRTGSAALSDYKGSGYDRGHLAPAGDFSYDEFALSQSFFMSNMSPQLPGFNRGVWKKLEDKVRDWAMEDSQIYVVTGPVLKKGLNTIGSNEVAVPEYYYKIILDMDLPEIKAVGFLMKNEKSSASLESFVVTIDRIESLTGLDFFPTLPDAMENALESKVVKSLWFD